MRGDKSLQLHLTPRKPQQRWMTCHQPQCAVSIWAVYMGCLYGLQGESHNDSQGPTPNKPAHVFCMKLPAR